MMTFLEWLGYMTGTGWLDFWWWLDHDVVQELFK